MVLGDAFYDFVLHFVGRQPFAGALGGGTGRCQKDEKAILWSRDVNTKHLPGSLCHNFFRLLQGRSRCVRTTPDRALPASPARAAASSVAAAAATGCSTTPCWAAA
mmetsp:Transcript_31461/g.72015  ORF Transcript_31461/g.72015 Transcript_31461/m.72015 type:complete len:106 (-) Transcript_31461:505-822(-)